LVHSLTLFFGFVKKPSVFEMKVFEMKAFVMKVFVVKESWKQELFDLSF